LAVLLQNFDRIFLGKTGGIVKFSIFCRVIENFSKSLFNRWLGIYLGAFLISVLINKVPIYSKFSHDRLKQVLQQNYSKSAQQIRSSIIDDLQAFINGYKIFDDITLVVIKRKATIA